MRNSKRRLRTIVTLMIFSLLLLTGFTAKWLMVQYHEEKRLLQRNLEALLNESREQLVDSLIEIQILGKLDPGSPAVQLKPADWRSMTIINSSSAMKIHMFHKDTLTTRQVITRREVMPEELKKGLARYVLRLDSGMGMMPLIDSDKLLERFQKRVSAGYPLRVAYLHTDTLTMLPVGSAYGAKQTRPYLLKRIGPQIAFTLLLLCLCSGAFLLAYRTIRRQIRMNEEKDHFISNMSHELKTPVATAKVAMEALTKFNALDDPSRTRDYLTIAEWEMHRLENLVNKVISNVQLSEGKLAIQKESLDLLNLCGEIMLHLQPIASAKQKQLRLLSEETGIGICGDRIHLQGMLYNLLDNALKYGGPHICIEVTRHAKQVSVVVSDNGPGIPPAYSKQLFERFFRVPTGNVHDVKGYGLGLSYARYVAIRHGGNIVYRGTPEEGAVFVVTLQLNDE